MQPQNDCERFNVDRLESSKHRQPICENDKSLSHGKQFIKRSTNANDSDVKIELTVKIEFYTRTERPKKNYQ